MEIPEPGNVYDLPRSARAIASDDVVERLRESFTGSPTNQYEELCANWKFNVPPYIKCCMKG